MIGDNMVVVAGRMSRVLLVVLLLAAMGLLVATTFMVSVGNDVGTFLTIADGVNRGQLPYRDFFDHKPPGIYYLFALILQVSGHSLTAVRVVHLVAIVMVAGLTALLARRLHDGVTGMLAGLMVLYGGSAFSATQMTAEVWVALFTVCAIGWLLRRWPTSDLAWTDWLLVGLLLGLATLFKQTALLTLLAVAIWAGFCPDPRITLTRRLPGLFLGFAMPIILAGLYFASQNGLTELWTDVVVANMCCYGAQERASLLRDGLVIVRAFPLFWLGLAAALVMAPATLHRTKLGAPPAAALLWLVVATSLLPLAHRAYIHYLFHAMPAAAILSAAAVVVVIKRLAAKSALAAGVTACILLALALVDAPRWPPYLAWTQRVQRQQSEVVEFIQKHTATEEPILAISSEPQFYFLSDRPPATRWLYLYDVNYSPEREQEWASIISDSEVRVVVTFDEGGLPWHGRLFRLLEQKCADSRAFDPYWHVFLCNRAKDA